MALKFQPSRIKELRESVGETQILFGARIGVSRQIVNMWESGATKPSTDTIEKLCDTFEVTPDFFYSFGE